jgi:hypothetical protein
MTEYFDWNNFFEGDWGDTPTGIPGNALNSIRIPDG